ncbi:hypothetical protein [Helicobacter felis]
MCCEDDLYEVFLKFKKGQPIEIEDKPLIERMLHYYKPEILPTKEQLEILKIWDPELRASKHHKKRACLSPKGSSSPHEIQNCFI